MAKSLVIVESGDRHEVPIAPRRVMTFRASQIMRDRIAKG